MGSDTYGTAQFKLEACVWVTRVYFVAPLEYFSKSCVSVDNCTRILRAIHARVMSPSMLAYVRACTHVTMHARSRKEFRSPRVTLFSMQTHETTILTCTGRAHSSNLCARFKDGPFMIDCV